MKNPLRFIIIDDDPINNTLCSIVIRNALGKVDIHSFTLPESGFEFISSVYQKEEEEEDADVLLLDINMPSMSGWEFLEHFENLNESVKDRFKIYLLSSSVDERDKERAYRQKHVVDYITKPLDIQKLKLITED